MTQKTAVRFTARDIALISVFAACTAVMTQIIIPIQPVPISLGNFAVMLCAMALPMRLSFTSQLTYILLGAFGAPIFTGFQGGFQKVIGPTGGYMLGYLAITLIVGFLKSRFPKAGFFGHAVMMLLGMAACLAFGTLWLAVGLGYTPVQAFLTGTAPFLVFDIIKAVCAVGMGYKLRDALWAAGMDL